MAFKDDDGWPEGTSIPWVNENNARKKLFDAGERLRKDVDPRLVDRQVAESMRKAELSLLEAVNRAVHRHDHKRAAEWAQIRWSWLDSSPMWRPEEL